MSFLLFIARRIAHAIGLLLAVLILNFALIHAAPGDIVQTIAGEMGGASPEIVEQLKQSWGLDRPFHQQLGSYLWRAAHGDLGKSAYFNMPVSGLVLDRIPVTVLLVFSALLLALFGGTALGVASARRPGSASGAITSMVALLGFSAPVFWSGLMLIMLFSLAIPLFPASGYFDVARNASGLEHVMDVAWHLVLPAFTLASVYLAIYARLARATMMEVLGADYVRTARAKWLSETIVVYKHALRNAVLPSVTMAGLQFSSMLAGAVLVETVFDWPGLGQLAYESILRRDNQLLLGILFYSALFVIVGNLLTDLAYRIVDPRIKTG